MSASMAGLVVTGVCVLELLVFVLARGPRSLGRTVATAAILASTVATAFAVSNGQVGARFAASLSSAQLLAACGFAWSWRTQSAQPLPSTGSLRQRLVRAERLALTGELAARVAHELKNPLAPIRGYAQLLRARLGALPESERVTFDKGLGIIEREAGRIEARLLELLQHTRAERGGAAGAHFDLKTVLVEAVEVCRGEPGVHRIDERYEGVLGAVRGDADELRAALFNLLKNAAEAMSPGGGAIELSACVEGAHAIIEVRDEGPGLTPELAERAAEPFFTTKPKGTGLGLSIARSAVESVGGKLILSARTDRAGAVARIVLPRA